MAANWELLQMPNWMKSEIRSKDGALCNYASDGPCFEEEVYYDVNSPRGWRFCRKHLEMFPTGIGAGFNAETSLSSRNAEPTSMNAPLTYPVGTGNVIGSHSAQDFIWAGRAEGETATHTPEETNTPYAGPITEPIGSEIKYGAEKIRWSTLKTLNYYIGGAAVVIGLGGILGVFSGGLKLTNVPIVGELFRGVKDSWDSKDFWSKTLMMSTFFVLIYLGSTATGMTYRYAGRSTVGQ